MKAALRTIAGGAALIGVMSAPGCVSNSKLPALNLAEPGWRLQETAVIWTPRRDGPELVGELLVAVHPDGRRWVQFSKQTMPVVSAQSAPGQWQISSSLGHGQHSGHGTPTTRVVWFQIDHLPPRPPAVPWSLELRPDGSWRLSNPHTGETLDAAPVLP